MAGHICSSIGLVGMVCFPIWFRNEYVGFLAAVVLYAIGGGVIEVLVSPIVEACPTKKKEAAMSQWACSFAESALQVSKTVGDLAGPCTFAFLMGTSRAIYGKYSDRIPLRKMMIGSAVLCIICYLIVVVAKSPVAALIGCAWCGFSVGIFWPGTFSMAAIKLPAGGTAMYALMALAGDIGCSAGSTVVGMIASANGDRLESGFMVAMGFPVLIFIGMMLLKENREDL